MRLQIHELAAAEIQHHHEWYQQRNPKVASRLADLFEATIVRIAQDPLQFALMEMSRNPGTIRRARLKGFPLYVLYRVKPDAVEVFAVPHTSQQPDYWKPRLRN
jgi:toxin ParE1/3/4